MKKKITLAVIAFLLGGAASWAWFTKGHDGEIEAITERVAADSARFAVQRATLEDSVRFWADSAARIEVDTVRIRVATDDVIATGETLEEHLTTDTVALRLWQEHRLADAHLAELWQVERDAWVARVEALSNVIEYKGEIIIAQDAELTAIRTALASMRREAERWRTKASPPFHVRLLRDGWKVAAGVGVGYLIAR